MRMIRRNHNQGILIAREPVRCINRLVELHCFYKCPLGPGVVMSVVNLKAIGNFSD
jgi:hypothetical protein